MKAWNKFLRSCAVPFLHHFSTAIVLFVRLSSTYNSRLDRTKTTDKRLSTMAEVDLSPAGMRFLVAAFKNTDGPIQVRLQCRNGDRSLLTPCSLISIWQRLRLSSVIRTRRLRARSVASCEASCSDPCSGHTSASAQSEQPPNLQA